MAIRCCEKIKKSQLLRISILLLEFPARWPVRPDPSFLGLETSSGRPVGQADDGSDSMETGSLASQPSLSGDLRPADQIDRQWPDPVDPPQAETFDSTDVTTGPSCGPLPETMRQALLQLVLGNEANDCYVNSVVQAELWRCCMDSNFGWQTGKPWIVGTCLYRGFLVMIRRFNGSQILMCWAPALLLGLRYTLGMSSKTLLSLRVG